VNVMDDLEERIREAVDASVADAEPRPSIIDAVRSRHRRHLMRVAAASVMTVAAVAAAVVTLALPRGGHSSPTRLLKTRHALAAFPGGGRLLFADRGGLNWLYADGREVRITAGFAGAALAASSLVTWNGTGVYVMRPDGRRRHMVLSFGSGKANGVIGVVGLSPDGSRLAYFVGADPVGVTKDTLWVVDLTTGHRVELGRVSSAMWRDNATIMATSVNGKQLLLINSATGSRSVYLILGDPVLVRAYERAQPAAGRPAVMNAGGFSDSRPSAPFAVQLGARGPFVGRQPAEVVLLGRGRVVTYAPPTPQQFEFSWGPDGLFLIQTGAGDNPASWNAYVGSISSDRLSKPIPYGMDGAIFNPEGSVIALQDGNQVTFLPTPRPECQRTTRCLSFQPKDLVSLGQLLAWVP
jgi:hypothetical protein